MLQGRLGANGNGLSRPVPCAIATRQAERLVQLLQQTLIEWQRHRALIEERVTYLERQFCPDTRE